MLKAAKKYANGSTNLDLRRGDLTALPLNDAEADAALMILALTYVVDPQAALNEMSRILKPGGRAIVVDLLKHDREDFRRQLGQKWSGFEPADLQRVLESAGFEKPTIRPLPPDESAKGPALFVATATKR